MTSVPVIPVGMWGTERVWPRSSRVPNVLNVTNPPLITIRVGDPVPLTGKSLDADTKRIMKAIVDLLPPDAREKRTPTHEELVRTYPSGKIPADGDHERERRPGTD
jgi:putative phosphoserine phosphatase/1-acylglycerol-3-phosphate O-acyltransferase